jgi:hypothetical protein
MRDRDRDLDRDLDRMTSPAASSVVAIVRPLAISAAMLLIAGTVRR